MHNSCIQGMQTLTIIYRRKRTGLSTWPLLFYASRSLFLISCFYADTVPSSKPLCYKLSWKVQRNPSDWPGVQSRKACWIQTQDSHWHMDLNRRVCTHQPLSSLHWHSHLSKVTDSWSAVCWQMFNKYLFGREELCFAVFANFYGVNTLTMAHFRPPNAELGRDVQCHWWKGKLVHLCLGQFGSTNWRRRYSWLLIQQCHFWVYSTMDACEHT